MAKTSHDADTLLTSLLEKAKGSPERLSLRRITRAYQFAKTAHDGQFRMSGEPYIAHPTETAMLLIDLSMDEDSIVAALLHDVPEDTSITVKEVQNNFGKTVAKLVNALTKLSKVYYKHSMDDRQVQTLRKIFLETAEDPRVVIIKLADRLHNMRTLKYLRPDKQQRIAKETLEIFAPLANIYGIFQLRRELEDECFRYLQPEEYMRIKNFVHDHEGERNKYIQETIRLLQKSLKKIHINAVIEGRPKHYYSIYQKMLRDNKMLQDIYDYFAIRIIVKNDDQCYRTLGLVHHLFKPKPRRFKDYVALPKPNGYRSIHTTVIGLRGQLTEIQIRTEDMHDDAELGIASHAVYKAWNKRIASTLMDLSHNKNAGRFMRNLQDDVLRNRIIIFTPTGEIVHLPEGSTPLDYVYALDLPVSPKAFRVIVNNAAYSLVGELKMGDRLQIIYTQKAQNGPERWWLSHVKTTKAKNKIQEFFSKSSFETQLKIGEELLQRSMDRETQGLVYQLPKKVTQRAVERYEVKNFGEILAGIGSGAIDADDVYNVLFPTLDIGWITHTIRWGFNLIKRIKKTQPNYQYKIRILLDAYDRVGLMKEIVQPFYELNIPIIRISGKGHDVRAVHSLTWAAQRRRTDETAFNPDYICRTVIDIFVADHGELISLFDRLEKIPGMVRVQRVFKRKQVGFVLGAIFTSVYFLALPFLLFFIKQSSAGRPRVLSTLMMMVGMVFVAGLLMMLRNMGNKTFPHLEETKYFWPMSFVVVTMAVASLFINNAAFALHLNTPLNVAFSLGLLGLFYFSQRSYERRNKRHLSRLKELDRQTQKSEEE